MPLSRRKFIAGGIGFVGLSLGPSQLLAAAAQSAAIEPRKAGSSKILVVVQLTGGNDGLNTVVPYTDSAYYITRPQLAISSARVLPLHGQLGLNPCLAGFHQLYKNEKLAVVQAVGYRKPSRSHFRSMQIWHTAEPDRSGASGWLGRYLDLAHTGARKAGNTFPAVNVDSVLPLTLKSSTVAVPSVSGVFETGLNAGLGSGEASSCLHEMTRRYRAEIKYPLSSFAGGLKFIARMIAGGANSRVYTTSLENFDTHANQAGVHGRLLKILSDGILAFQSDLEIHRVDEDVLILVFSEFGRRLAVNQEGGTDHGSAQPLFLIGSRVNAGIYGDHPSLLDLESGDLKYKIDFRTIYATILDRWMYADSRQVLGSDFDYLTFV